MQKKSSIESCIAQNVWLIDTESKNLSSNIEQSRRIPISAVCFSILIRVCMFQHTCFSLVLKALTPQACNMFFRCVLWEFIHDYLLFEWIIIMHGM